MVVPIRVERVVSGLCLAMPLWIFLGAASVRTSSSASGGGTLGCMLIVRLQMRLVLHLPERCKSKMTVLTLQRVQHELNSQLAYSYRGALVLMHGGVEHHPLNGPLNEGFSPSGVGCRSISAPFAQKHLPVLVSMRSYPWPTYV